MRTAVAVKVLGPNGWEKLGKGELMLVYHTPNGQSRIIFFAEAGTARVYGAADINAWLVKAMKNDKVQEKSINVRSVATAATARTNRPNPPWSDPWSSNQIMLIESGKPVSYILQLSSSKERDLLWELFDKVRIFASRFGRAKHAV